MQSIPQDNEILRQTAEALQKSFEFSLPTRIDGVEQLVGLLVPVISQWLDHEMEKLLQFCYRIDLREEKLKSILHESPPGRLAEDLSRAIVWRQLQKFELRKRYSG